MLGRSGPRTGVARPRCCARTSSTPPRWILAGAANFLRRTPANSGCWNTSGVDRLRLSSPPTVKLPLKPAPPASVQPCSDRQERGMPEAGLAALQCKHQQLRLSQRLWPTRVHPLAARLLCWRWWCCAPNYVRISCGPSNRRPHYLTFHSALRGPAARAEPGAISACRLHARVRPHRGEPHAWRHLNRD